MDERVHGPRPHRQARREARHVAPMTEVWPDYDDYQERTDREIPVVVLERE